MIQYLCYRSILSTDTSFPVYLLSILFRRSSNMSDKKSTRLIWWTHSIETVVDNNKMRKEKSSVFFSCSADFSRLATVVHILISFSPGTYPLHSIFYLRTFRFEWFWSQCHQQWHCRPQKSTPLANFQKYFRSILPICPKSFCYVIPFTLCCERAHVSAYNFLL